MSTENETETELRTAADFIQEAARYVNWKPDEKHPQQARYDALTALNSFHAYSTAVALETLRRVAPDAAQRIAQHLSEDMYWDINHENSWAWEQSLAAGQPIPADAWPFPQITGQTESEHHTGSLNLTGEGNAPASPISDELVNTAAEHLHSVEQTYFGPSTYAPHIAQMLARAALEAAYPAIRQQVAEEIAAAIEQQRDPDGFDIAVNLDATITKLAAIAREIGGTA